MSLLTFPTDNKLPITFSSVDTSSTSNNICNVNDDHDDNADFNVSNGNDDLLLSYTHVFTEVDYNETSFITADNEVKSSITIDYATKNGSNLAI